MNGHANYEYLVLYSARLKIMVMATILRRFFLIIRGGGPPKTRFRRSEAFLSPFFGQAIILIGYLPIYFKEVSPWINRRSMPWCGSMRPDMMDMAARSTLPPEPVPSPAEEPAPQAEIPTLTEAEIGAEINPPESGPGLDPLQPRPPNRRPMRAFSPITRK